MEQSRIDLCRHRLDKAETCLNTAHITMNNGDYYTAANRSYYAIFHSIRALLAVEGVDRAKHSGVIAYFQKNYVKTGIFGKEYSKIAIDSFEVRSDSDYDDFFVISRDEVEKQLENARFFVDGIKAYLEKDSIIRH